MQFKLAFDIPISSEKINLKSQIFSIGSCFSDEIGEILQHNKFNLLKNPFGVLFNPISIFKILNNELDKNRIVQNQEVFYHWDLHSKISALDKNELSETLHKKINQTQIFIEQSDWIILTFGSAFVYKLIEDDGFVANCHKMPANLFSKKILEKEQILEKFNVFKSKFQKKKIILTVSPVRHIKEGLVENNRSKAILLDAVHHIVEQFENVFYFPAYEIMLDELRDYRFYKSDLIHPSKEAVNYVWEKFKATFMDDETQIFLKEWQKIQAAIAHSSFHPKTSQHQSFLKQTIQKLHHFSDKIDISKELLQLENQLI